MKITERFDAIEARLDEITNLLLAQQQAQQPAESPRDILSLEEAAKYLGVAARTLRARKAGTAGIPRYSDRPVQFMRANLDQFKRARVESDMRRQQSSRKLSLVRRRKSA